MPLRRHEDPTGRVWNIWNVPPRFSRARGGERREQPTPGFEPDRRVTPDRRIHDTPAEWSTGWVCFDGGEEKRRLYPIPEDWDTADKEVLQRYLDQALPVAPGTPIDES